MKSKFIVSPPSEPWLSPIDGQVHMQLSVDEYKELLEKIEALTAELAEVPMESYAERQRKQ